MGKQSRKLELSSLPMKHVVIWVAAASGCYLAVLSGCSQEAGKPTVAEWNEPSKVKTVQQLASMWLVATPPPPDWEIGLTITERVRTDQPCRVWLDNWLLQKLRSARYGARSPADYASLAKWSWSEELRDQLSSLARNEASREDFYRICYELSLMRIAVDYSTIHSKYGYHLTTNEIETFRQRHHAVEQDSSNTLAREFEEEINAHP